MTDTFSLEELLCVYPFSHFENRCFGEIENIFFTKVIDEIQSIKGNELLLLHKDNFEGDWNGALSNAVQSEVSAIFIVGEENISHLLDCKKHGNVPILCYKESITVEQIQHTLQLIQHLKRLNQFQTFIKNYTYQMINQVNEIGIGAYLENLEKRLSTSIWVTDLYFEEPLNRNERNPLPVNTVVQLRNHCSIDKKDGEVETYFTIQIDDQIYTIYPLSLNRNKVGYLLLDRPVSIYLSLQIEAIIPIITAELKKKYEIKMNEKKYHKTFIYDLLHNNFDSPYVMINQGRHFGWDFTKPYSLLLMELEHKKGLMGEMEGINHIEKIIKNTLSALFYQTLIFELDGLIIILIAVDHSKTQKEMKKDSKKVDDILSKKIYQQEYVSQVNFAMGRFYPTMMDICRSYQEAKMALEFGKGNTKGISITHFEDLGVVRLLTNIRQDVLDEFSEEYLSELQEFDRQNDTDFLNTLEVYCEENGNLKSTADQLFIHINTLRNRIKKIETILKIDLQNYQDILNLLISFKIKQLKEE